MDILQKIAHKFNQIDIADMSVLEKQIASILESQGLLIKEEIPYGVGEGESYWVYSVPPKEDQQEGNVILHPKDAGLSLEEIKEAVLSGKTVHWNSENYVVRKDELDQWHIVCLNNDSCIGLTTLDSVTLNGRREEFFLG